MINQKTFLGYLKRNPLFVVSLVMIAFIDSVIATWLIPDLGIRMIIQSISGIISAVPVIILWMKFIDPV